MADLGNVKNRSQKKTPRRRSKELSTQRLFKAGIEVFSKFGFEAATTKLIAKRAGMNEALIARYFKSKNGLLQSIILAYVESKKKDADAYTQRKTLSEEIESYIFHGLDKYQSNRDFNRIILSRALADRNLAQQLEKFAYVLPSNTFLFRLEEYQKSGEIAAGRDLVSIAHTIHIHLMGIFLLHTVLSEFDLELNRKAASQFALDLARGLKEPLAR